MEEPKNNNEKGKNITILGSKSIAVPDVKSYILWHYGINMKTRVEYKETKKRRSPLNK